MRSRRKGGIETNALGRSRGGFSTKINARTNAEGLPIGIVITAGQAHDVTAYPALMQEVDDDPQQMLADKGYDSDDVRDDIEKRGGEAVIPTKANQLYKNTRRKWSAAVDPRTQTQVGLRAASGWPFQGLAAYLMSMP